MKRLITLLLLISASTPILFGQQITIGEDGILRCKDVPIGTTQTILGDTYEVVDRGLLILRKNEKKDLSKVCVSNITDMNSLFFKDNNRTNIESSLSSWDVSNVTNMYKMFFNSNIKNGLEKWDVSNVTNMEDMFAYAYEFNEDIGNWNVSKVTSMRNMFAGAKSIDGDLSNWDVSNVTDFSGMFSGGKYIGITQIGFDITSWNISNATNLRGMFSGTNFNQDISGWDVSKVTNMSGMFAESPFNQDISGWDVSQVTYMGGMFLEATSFDQDISSWDFGKVEQMGAMFSRAKIFPRNMASWDVSSVKDMSGMFSETTFNQDISGWDVSNVTNMFGMFFRNSAFNHDIGKWKVDKVIDMGRMFTNASAFNQNLSDWCVYLIKSEPLEFSIGSPLAIANKPKWGKCATAPAKIMLATPINSGNSIELYTSFSWVPDSNSTVYQLQVFEGFDPLVLDTVLDATTFKSVEALKGNVTHNWRVRGINQNKDFIGEWSSVWSFTTVEEPIPPSEPKIPFNGQENVGTLTEFSWNNVDSATAYHLQLSLDTTYSSLVFESTEIESSPYILSESLDQNTTFHWRIRALSDNELRHSEWSQSLSFTTGVRTSIDAVLPISYRLEQNYPNPFNPSTTIRYSLPEATQVRVEVFSLLGQSVGVLMDGVQQAGVHQISFDASDLTTGIYLYRLTTPAFTQTRQMMLIK